MSRRIILDLSDLYLFLSWQERISGIQRVVLNLATRLRNDSKLDLTFAYYNPVHGCYATFPEQSRLDDIENLRSRTLPPRGAITLPQPRRFEFEKYANRPVRGFYNRHRRALQKIAVNRINVWLARLSGGKEPQPLSFRAGDILLTLGAGWDAIEMYRHIEPFARDGLVTPIVLVHDLIPLLNIPERGGISADIFEEWLRLANRCSARFLAVSEHTRRDLADYLQRTGAGDRPIEVVRLPNEFLLSDKAPPSGALLALAQKEYVLSIGPPAIKNGNRLAQAWARLARQIGSENMPLLVFAGNGARSDLTAEGLDPVEDLMVFVRRPSDVELAQLYRNALFTVFPSIYEGFGLPVAESHWFGKFCVASNTSSIPEVGGDLCDYFDPLDVESMAAAIERPIVDRDYLASREAAIDRSKLLNWNQSAAILRDTVMRIADRG